MANTTPTNLCHERDIDAMTDEELCDAYVQLCHANAALMEEEAALQAKIAAHGEQSVRVQQSREVAEDKVANQLLRRLESESRETCRCRELIRREERSREAVAAEVARVRAEKTAVESQLAEEQRSLMRQLQQKLLDVVNRKSDAERELLQERRRYLDLLAAKLAQLKKGAASGARGSGAGDMSLCSAAEAETKASNSVSETPPTSVTAVTKAEGNNAESIIMGLEKRLNHMLRKHTVATREAAKNEEMCIELRGKLESIQQAAFLDRARAVKLKEELGEVRVRLAGMEQRSGANSTLLEDSFCVSTPAQTPLKNLSLRDRTKEVLSAPLQCVLSSLHLSGDTSDINDDTRSFTSSLMRSPAFGAASCTDEREGTPYRMLDIQLSRSASMTPKSLH